MFGTLTPAKQVSLARLVFAAMLGFAAFARAESSIPVYAVLSDGTMRSGTAVYVSVAQQLWIVTAYHVVREAQSIELSLEPGRPGVEAAELLLGEAGSCVFPKFELFALPVANAALARWSGIRPASLTAARVSKGAVVAVGNANQTILGTTRVLRNFVEIGTIAGREFASNLPRVTHNAARTTELLIVASQGITKGFSGGPLFRVDEIDGDLLGIVIGGDSSTGRVWALPADLIHAALTHCSEKERLHYRKENQSWPPPDFRERLYADLSDDKTSWELGLEVGTDWMQRAGFQTANRAVFGFGPVWQGRKVSLGLSVGMGYVLAIVDRRLYDPLQVSPVDEPGMNLLHGVRLEFGTSLRLPLFRRGETHVGAKLYSDGLLMDPSSPPASGNSRSWRSGVKVELGWAYRRGIWHLLPSLGVGWERQPTFDRYYTGTLAHQHFEHHKRGLVAGVSLRAGLAL